MAGKSIKAGEQTLGKKFFARPVDEVAKDLVGKILVRKTSNGEIRKMRILTTEAYGGGKDSSMPDPASHSHEDCPSKNNNGKGQEKEGGNLYIAYSGRGARQLNITTGEEGDAQAVLIKECQLLYKDNNPNKENEKTKGFLTETKIAERLKISNVDVGGHTFEEFGISVVFDGELIENTERKNAKGANWRYSIKRLLTRKKA